MSKRSENNAMRAAEVAKANEVAAHLQRAAQLSAIPEKALNMKAANDLHSMIVAAAKDTRELVKRVDGVLSPEEVDVLHAYRVELDALEERATILYAKTLAMQVKGGGMLKAIGVKLDEIEKKHAELLEAAAKPPEEKPTSSLIELPNK